MDIVKFKKACENIISAEREEKGIGTLGEKTLHAVVKHYIEPEKLKHEIKVCSYYADIVTDRGIIEIQTRAFIALRKKLALFLEVAPVTIVYPLPKTKWLIWIDRDTGEVTKKRKSPKQGGIFDAINELYNIKSFLNHPDFSLQLIFLDVEEYRCLDGWSEDKKRGSTRYDRIPVGISEEVHFNKVSDYQIFVPDTLQQSFTSRDYMRAAKVNLRTSQTALNILNHIGVVKRTGRQGNLHIYERNFAWSL